MVNQNEIPCITEKSMTLQIIHYVFRIGPIVWVFKTSAVKIFFEKFIGIMLGNTTKCTKNWVCTVEKIFSCGLSNAFLKEKAQFSVFSIL